jgi:hypothetical protein
MIRIKAKALSFFAGIWRTAAHCLDSFWKTGILWFDFLAVGPVFKKLFIFMGIFAFFFLLWWVVFAYNSSDFTGQINRDIGDDLWAIAAQMLDPGNQHMVGKESTLDKVDFRLRLFVLLITVSGTLIFSGLLISTFFSIFEQRTNIVREGLMNYHYRNHIVILGSNSLITGLIKQLCLRRGRIVILTSQQVPEVRRFLQSGVSKQDMKRIYVLYGDRTRKEDLNRLYIPHACELYILGENNEADHDSRNDACFVEIEKLLKEYYMHPEEYKKVLECNILFESQTTYAAHQVFNFQKLNTNGKREATPLNVNAFSFYEKWAQKVFVACKHNEITYDPLDFKPIAKDSDQYIHLIVAGMTRMGIALGVQAARLGHYANFEHKKTRITFIDSDAEREMNYFASRYQSFFKAVDVTFIDLSADKINFKKGTLPFINIELVFVKARFEHPELREKIVEWSSDKNALTTLAICDNNPGNCLAAGLYLPAEIYHGQTRVLVHQETEHSILSLMYPDDRKVVNLFANVKPFGSNNDCLDLKFQDDFKAKAINYFYCNNNYLPESFDDHDLAVMNSEWNRLRERFKWSSRYSAETIPDKLRALGSERVSSVDLNACFSAENIELLAQIEHARWNVDTLLAGFYPPTEEVMQEALRNANRIWEAYLTSDKNEKDPDYIKMKEIHDSYVGPYKKSFIHPCLVPFENLSEYYKDIDRRLVSCIPLIEKGSAIRQFCYESKKKL